MTHPLRDQFLLDADITFLNHGSFGACPRPVFEAYQNWQRELERQPVQFLLGKADGLLNKARRRLGDYLHTAADNLIFVPNATTGVNTVARSLNLQPGDEVLTTNHEYGAMDATWEFICQKTGAIYRHQPIPVPLPSVDEIVETIWSAVTPRTKVLFLSHITSPTALILPIRPFIQRARKAGILTVIDGAHVPGQLPLDVEEIGADFYTGNCHKWLCAPKGSAFLYARPEHHALLEPLVISWGMVYGEPTFTQRNQWQGTRDISAFLSVPAAIDFQAEHDWPTVRAECHALANQMREGLAELFGTPPICPDSPEWFGQMIAAPLPEPYAHDVEQAMGLQARLWEDYRIEVPMTAMNGQCFLRVSFQGYNSWEDGERLLTALTEILKG